jgi:phosphotransacetylase
MALLLLTGAAIAAGILLTHMNKPITTDSSGASSQITVTTTTIATSNTSLNTMITSGNITGNL